MPSFKLGFIFFFYVLIKPNTALSNEKEAVVTGPSKSHSEYQVGQHDKEMFLRMQRLFENGQSIELKENPHAKKIDAIAQEIKSKQGELIEKNKYEALEAIGSAENVHDLVAEVKLMEAGNKAQEETDIATKYFVSFDMPQNILNEIILLASNDKKSVIFVRGMRPEMRNIAQMLKFTNSYLEQLIASRKIKNKPSFLLDNTEFITNNVYVVPTIVYENNHGKIRVEGLTNTDWLNQQIKKGIKDSGRVSEVFEIGEPDLKEHIARIIDDIDWEKKQKLAHLNFWKKHSFINVRHAEKDNVFYVDPTITFENDVAIQDGRLLARKGTKLNPLLLMKQRGVPTNHPLIVFDARHAGQVEFAKKMHSKLGSNSILITSHINATDGWKHYSNLMNEFGKNIYVLNQQLQSRFAIEEVPSTIEADDLLFMITTYSPTHWKLKEN